MTKTLIYCNDAKHAKRNPRSFKLHIPRLVCDDKLKTDLNFSSFRVVKKFIFRT